MSNLTAQDFVVRTGEGESTASDMSIIYRTEQMNGDFSVMEGVVRPYELLAPHTHENEDQCVYILEGELEFEIGGAGGLRFSADAGSYVLKPRGVSHGFWNSKITPVRYIELSGRDGFERFIDARQNGLDAMLEAAMAGGMQIHVDRIPELMAEHGLKNLAGINWADVTGESLPMMPQATESSM